MCEISKNPTAVRVAWCSAVIDEYCTGIDQPAKSTMRPPCAACQSWSVVRASSVVMAIGGPSRRLLQKTVHGCEWCILVVRMWLRQGANTAGARPAERLG